MTVADAAEAITRAGEDAGGPILPTHTHTTGRDRDAARQGQGEGTSQELALRLARSRPGAGWCSLSGGTDGRDRPTRAAGGIVDETSAARMVAAGVDPVAFSGRQ